MLTFKQIEALYWVVQLGGFANAAERLNTTQSAITKRIQELETSFNIQIFDRSGQKATLTRTGEDLLELAADLLARRDQMLLKMKGFKPFTGSLRLGITEITAMTWLPQLMQALRAAFPELAVQLKIGMAWNLQQNLLSGQLDMAILHWEIRNPHLESEPLAQVDFGWAGSPALISPAKVYTPEDISRMNVIRQDPDSALNVIYDEWLAPYTAQTNLFTINSLQAMVGLTVAGLGVACIPLGYFSDLFKSRKLVQVRTTKPLPTSMYCAMYARQSNPMFYREIARIARDVCDFTRPYGGGLSV
ncbi:LysR family transcriptional regulator [Bordetella genomosp. 7]|uniref:LysR family transcriptional regulator n=1 Tax=Bordetella genomosp. 7 TaxID=1416805 RepID=A0A261QU25_9BORD|nr:LysR family transcriptional regulator [Bordetella genomosp. 7]OZI16285.1 LysR family transcriptional regulator [Bordetella genomosp. 7]OZI16992.1 LysR family transcriptional regulator [Bordetella genomosp. 7]